MVMTTILKDTKTLMIYYSESPENIADKLG
jgi:hypothetical protein